MRFDVAKGSQHLSHGRIHTFKNIGHKDTGNQRHNILNAWQRDDIFYNGIRIKHDQRHTVKLPIILLFILTFPKGTARI